MPGIRILTNLPAQRATDAAHQAARTMGFRAQPVGEGEFALSKGSFASSLFFGLLAPYCKFQLQVQRRAPGEVEIAVARNHPWWSGPIGVGRVKDNARDLVQAIEMNVLQLGGEVISRSAF